MVICGEQEDGEGVGWRGEDGRMRCSWVLVSWVLGCGLDYGGDLGRGGGVEV